MDSSKNICAKCAKLATTICSGCLNAPEHQKGDSNATYYCCKQCQVADRRQHVTRCKLLKERKELQRAAGILQEIVYKIRTHAFPLGLKSIQYDGSNVFLHLVKDRSEDVKLKQFPNHLVDETLPTKAILVHSACTEALIYLYGFSKLLLSRLSANLEEVHTVGINPRLKIFEIDSDGHMTPKPGEDYISHAVYRVTLRNGETWALDTTGAQLGYPEPLVPWKNFWCTITIDASTFGINHKCVVKEDRLLQPHERHALARTVEKQFLAKALEEKIPVLVREHGTDLSSLLTGTDNIFQNARERFLGRFEFHLKDIMVELYAPEKTRLRVQEYNRRKEAILALIELGLPDQFKDRISNLTDEFNS